MTPKSRNGFAVAALSAFISAASLGTANASDRSITFDSRYIQGSDQQHDIRGLMSFGEDINDLRGIGLDWATDRWGSSVGNRIGVFAFSELLAGLVMDQSFQTPLHEQAHGSRYAAGGQKYEFNGGEDSFFAYYFDNFGDDEGYTVATGTHFTVGTKAAEFIAKKGGADYTDLVISAAGVNAEMAYADYLQDQMYFKGSHISQGISLLTGKTSTARYGKSDDGHDDISDIEARYKALNVDVDSDDMDQANLTALLLSASTWRYLFGVYEYAQTGETQLNAWEFHGFRIPDFTSYVTSRGLSMKMDTGYRFNDDLFLTLAVEHVYEGDSETEYHIGVRKEFPFMKGLTVTGNVITGYGSGYRAEAELNVSDSVSLYAGANYDEIESLNGERYIVSLKDDIEEWSAFAGIRWHY